MPGKRGEEDTTTDARLLQRALAQRWPLTPENRARALARVVESLEKPNLSVRARIAILRSFGYIDEINLRSEAQDMEQIYNEQLESLRAELRAAREEGSGGGGPPG